MALVSFPVNDQLEVEYEPNQETYAEIPTHTSYKESII